MSGTLGDGGRRVEPRAINREEGSMEGELASNRRSPLDLEEYDFSPAPVAVAFCDAYAPTDVRVVGDGPRTQRSLRLPSLLTRRRGPMMAAVPISLERVHCNNNGNDPSSTSTSTTSQAHNEPSRPHEPSQAPEAPPQEHTEASPPNMPPLCATGAGRTPDEEAAHAHANTQAQPEQNQASSPPEIVVVPEHVPVAEALGGAVSRVGSEGGWGWPTIANATPHHDGDHIISLSPDQIRLYQTWKTSKRLALGSTVSMALTAFWVLKFRVAFTLFLVPLLGWYAARGFSLMSCVLYLCLQCLPIGFRIYVLLNELVESMVLEALYYVSLAVEAILIQITIRFINQLRRASRTEVRLLRTVYHDVFRRVERTTEGYWTC